MVNTYVALLRGINVGGRNRIRMADLSACFEAHGYAGVSTYIQSGNVLFSSQEPDRDTLTAVIEAMLSSAFDYSATVTMRSHSELQDVVDSAPPGFGAAPESHLSDVVFLMPPVAPSDLLDGLPLREGVDEAFGGPAVVYFRRLKARAAQSRLSRVASLPTYRRMTIRSWGTTTKLLALMQDSPRDA